MILLVKAIGIIVRKLSFLLWRAKPMNSFDFKGNGKVILCIPRQHEEE